MSDWFCRCCKEFYKDDNPTFIREGSDDQLCYETTSMCLKCYKRSNGNNDYMDAIRKNDEQIKQFEESRKNDNV